MRTSAWIAVALVMLLVGAAAGYAFRGDDGQRPTPLYAPENRPAPVCRPAASQAPDDQPAPRPVEPESLREVLERYRPARVPGTATLEVVVLDNLNRGIEGAEITASFYVSSGEQQSAADPMEALLERVERLARESLSSMDRMQTAVSDVDGRVKFEDILAGSYLIRAQHADWEIERGFAKVEPSAQCVLRGTPQRMLPVRILMPDGSTPADCKLTASLGGSANALSGSWMEWAPAEPAIRLRQGSWHLRASIGSELIGDAIGYVPAIGEPPEVTIQLTPRFEITGRVSFTGARPAGRLEMCCTLLNPGDPVEAGLLGPNRHSTGLSRDDEFKIGGLQAGQYCVSARVGSNVLAYIAAEAGGEVELAVTSPTDPACSVTVEPAEAAAESWRFTLAFGNDHVTPEIWRQADGELLFFFPEQRKSAEFRLSLHSERHGTLGFTGNWKKGMHIKLKAEPPAMLQVRLNGVPPALEQTLRLVLWQPATGWSWDGSPIAAGDVRWWTTRPFQPGELSLCVKAGRDFQWIYDKRSVRCVPGENFVEIDFPQIWTLTIAASGSPNYTIIEWLDEADAATHVGSFHSVPINAETSATLTCVPAGRYRVRYQLGGDKTVDFPVPATDRVYLK